MKGPTAVRRLLIACALVAVPVALAAQSPAPTTLRVETRVIPPLVIGNKGQFDGYSIELWNEIAEKLGVKTEWSVAQDVVALLADVKAGKADLGVAAISITAERDKSFDFSQPILDAGLDILVRGSATEPMTPLDGLARLLFSRALLIWLGIAFLLVLVPAHIVWFLERRHQYPIVPTKRYFPGIFHAMWWAASALVAQADTMPRGWLARIVAVLWMFTGVVFIAFYTAQLTATLTVQQIQGAINGPGDLAGKTVATTRGSTSAAYVRSLHGKVTEVENIEDAYAALLEKKVDAVVFDAPVLLYYAAHEGKGKVYVVGNVFRREDYGIVFQPGSPWRKRVDGALLSLREDGTVDRLYDKWFGGK